MIPAESEVTVVVAVMGYKVTSPVTGNGEHDNAELRELLDDVAEEIASQVGMALADLGTSCTGGEVVVLLEGNLGRSG